MEISKKIIDLRKRQNMTQEELANRLNVSRQTISKWENGTVLPDVYNLKELAKVFDISVDELLNDEKVIKDDNEIVEAIDHSVGIVKKHWRKVGYVVIYYGIAMTLFGVITLLMVSNFGRDQFTGEVFEVFAIFHLLPKIFIGVGIVVIIIGAILAIKDYFKNHRKSL